MRTARGGQPATPALFTEFKGTVTCTSDHTFPALAGACPHCPTPVGSPGPPRLGVAPGMAAVPAVVQMFVEDFVLDRDTDVAPRWPHAFGYEQHKLGLVNHIPVCDTLAQLTAYFNGGGAQGSTHFGIGREQAGTLTWNGVTVPCAPVHQYMPITGPCAPWAQGLIQTSDRCPVPPSPAVHGMRQGEPNGAFISIENVARSGRDGVTDPQFNSNVMIRAYCAAFFGFAVTPLSQLWHSEVDQACVTPETRILTRDLRWVPAGDLQPDDAVFGFDDEPTIQHGTRSRGLRAWREATVTATGRELRPVYEITTERGTRLRATGEHRWLVRRGIAPGGVIDWVKTEELFSRQHHNRFGSYLPRFFQTWVPARDFAGGYLSAAFDGEGHVLASGKRAPVLGFTQRPNSMLDRVRTYLDERGIGYRIRVARSTPNENHPTWNPCATLSINGSFSNVVRTLGELQPPRLMDVWKSIRIDGLRMVSPQSWDERIVAVASVGEREIVTLTSSSGTYIAEGFGAHNTRCNDPGWEGALEDAMQAAARRLLAGDLGGLRGAVTAPAPRPAVDYKALYIAELEGGLAAARDDVMRATVREREILRKLEAVGTGE